MASVSAFNDMMTQFLVELQRTFPQEKGIKTCITQFEMLRKANPRKCVDAFMAARRPRVAREDQRTRREFHFVRPQERRHVERLKRRCKLVGGV